MKAVILAAGEGSRMRPLTLSRPKPMVPFGNKPILEHLIIESCEAGIREFIIVVGYKSEVIVNYFGDGSKWGAKIDYRLQTRAIGTADAVRLTEGAVQEKFLVMNGDMLLRKDDIGKLAKSEGMSMAVKEVSDVNGFGVIEAVNGEIKHIFEKPDLATSKLVNVGAYCLTETLFKAIANTPISSREQYELTDSLELLLEQGIKIKCQPIEFWLNFSYPWDLLSANETFLSDIESCNSGVIEEGVHIQGPYSIGPNTRIRSGSYIIGPVIIGQNCDIGPNCYIRSSTSIGDGCHVGASVEIKNSIIMSGTKIPHQSYVGDSVIGEKCNLGAGTKVANLRFDHKNIKVGRIDSGRHKLGAIIGNNVQTGINTSINAGTLIGDDVYIWPGTVVHGDIDAGKKVVTSRA